MINKKLVITTKDFNPLTAPPAELADIEEMWGPNWTFTLSHYRRWSMHFPDVYFFKKIKSYLERAKHFDMSYRVDYEELTEKLKSSEDRVLTFYKDPDYGSGEIYWFIAPVSHISLWWRRFGLVMYLPYGRGVYVDHWPVEYLVEFLVMVANEYCGWERTVYSRWKKEGRYLRQIVLDRLKAIEATMLKDFERCNVVKLADGYMCEWNSNDGGYVCYFAMELTGDDFERRYIWSKDAVDAIRALEKNFSATILISVQSEGNWHRHSVMAWQSPDKSYDQVSRRFYELYDEPNRPSVNPVIVKVVTEAIDAERYMFKKEEIPMLEVFFPDGIRIYVKVDADESDAMLLRIKNDVDAVFRILSQLPEKMEIIKLYNVPGLGLCKHSEVNLFDYPEYTRDDDLFFKSKLSLRRYRREKAKEKK